MKAEEARKMYNKLYTLYEILNHIGSVAAHSRRVYGYKSERLDEEVRGDLDRLGYNILDDDGSITISWEEDG